MFTNENSMAIIILCSHLCVGGATEPLTPKEWSQLADLLISNTLEPKDILSLGKGDLLNVLCLTDDEIIRYQRLIARSASLSFEIQKYINMGINIITRADLQYPKKLKQTLGKACPPLFYYAGDIDLANKRCVGFAGSRTIDLADEEFTKKTVTTINNRYSIVSGGAKGVDSIASEMSINNGASAIEYICDSLDKKIRNKSTINAIKSNQLLVLSVAKPDAAFNTGFAMMRNKYIYAQSRGTVVVKADYEKGGTWNGAMENLNKKWCTQLCWNNALYKGNTELIKKGAIPVDETWNGEIPENKKEESVQLSIFESL